MDPSTQCADPLTCRWSLKATLGPRVIVVVFQKFHKDEGGKIMEISHIPINAQHRLFSDVQIFLRVFLCPPPHPLSKTNGINTVAGCGNILLADFTFLYPRAL